MNEPAADETLSGGFLKKFFMGLYGGSRQQVLRLAKTGEWFLGFDSPPPGNVFIWPNWGWPLDESRAAFSAKRAAFKSFM